MALKLRPAKLSPAMAAFFKLCEEKLGFVPNVMQAFSFDMAKLEAFVAYRNDLMLGDSGLSVLEREMIATAVSAQKQISPSPPVSPPPSLSSGVPSPRSNPSSTPSFPSPP